MNNGARILALAAAVALIGLAACGGEKPAQKADGRQARAVTYDTVQRRALQGGISASGPLVSREEAAVVAEVNGFRVARVMADVGDYVKAGQVLVQLDDTLLQSQIAQQSALAAQAEVAARQAKAQAERVAGLDGTGAVAGEQIEQRQFQAQSSAAQAAAQNAALADLKTRAAKMAVRAPVSGLVLERNVDPGQISGAGGAAPMFSIARDSLVELQAQVGESDLPSIQVGAPVRVTLPNGDVLQGKVRLIEPTVQQDSRLGLVRVALPTRQDLRPGGHATAQFSDLRANVLSVPETAVHYDADKVSVFVIGPDNHVKEVAVETGRRGGGFVELVSGPPEGSKVLLGSSSFVLEGDLVDPHPAQAPEAGSGPAGAPQAAAK